MTGLDILKRIGYDNSSITPTEEWIAKEGYALARLDEINKHKEFIICAACFYRDGQAYAHGPTNVKTGLVIAGRRHHNCIAIFAKIHGFPYTEEAQSIYNTEVQGFLTNTNRFVSRQEALIIATAANQLILGEGNQNLGLFSEDLY